MNEIIDIQKIYHVCNDEWGIPNHRIWNIYLYGSRVYGTNTAQSDYDFLVLVSSQNDHREYNDGKCNIHAKNYDIFKDELWDYNMLAMECIYAPPFAKIQETMDFKQNMSKIYRRESAIELKRQSLSQSHAAWVRAKMMLVGSDIHRGMKSAWHSLRILMFARQILEKGEIYNFSEANEIWDEVKGSSEVDWRGFKDMLLPRKRELERAVKYHC